MKIRWKMSVRSIIVIISIFLSAFIAHPKPNVLLIVSEDNGPELGCYGDNYVNTPNLDALAREGVLFQNAYVPQAGCSQSRAALLTGLYPHQNGQIGLATWKFKMYSSKLPNLISEFKNIGYRTGIIGKLHINPEGAFPFDFKKIPSSNFARKDLGEYAQFAGDFISESDTDAPFLLSVNYPDPHRPFLRQVGNLPATPLAADDVKPLDYFGLEHPSLRKDTANYYNSLSRLDSLVGDLLRTLEKSGKDKNTIVVYLGDHGADMLRGKRTSYEGGLKIPLIIRYPGVAKPNLVVEELTTTLDLFPTFMDIVGMRKKVQLPGKSLLPLLQNKSVRWREYLYAEYHTHSAHNYYPQRSVRNYRFKLIHNLQPNEFNPGYQFTKDKFYNDLDDILKLAPDLVRNAYSLMAKPPEFELYDLKDDPYEFNNLSGSRAHLETLEDLKEKLSKWRHDTKDPFLDPENIRILKREIDASRVGDQYKKNLLNLNYEKYFFK